MRIQTMSLVVGTKACNASCPFCVSRMTGMGMLPATPALDERGLRKAVLLAVRGGVTTVLFTGKGEPTLYPHMITEYMQKGDLGDNFPILELQTNVLGIGRLAEHPNLWDRVREGHQPREVSRADLKLLTHLRRWHDMGLDTICVSTVGITAKDNRKVYLNDRAEYPDLSRTIDYIHSLNFQVRLCVMMQAGMVDTPEKVSEVIEWARERGIAQVTFRPIRRPEDTEDTKASSYVMERGLTAPQVTGINLAVQESGKLLLKLMHGAQVFDVGGQNVCLSDCLTHSPDPNQMRQIIFYPDGRLAYNWTDNAATIFQGKKR